MAKAKEADTLDPKAPKVEVEKATPVSESPKVEETPKPSEKEVKTSKVIKTDIGTLPDASDSAEVKAKKVKELDVAHLKEAIKNGSKATLIDKIRSRVLKSKNKSFLAYLEMSNPELKKKLKEGFDVSKIRSYTNEELEAYMSSNFDYFQINGTMYHDRGRKFNGRPLPTGQAYAVCTLEDFVDVITRKGDSNHGYHRYSIEDDSYEFRNNRWRTTKITKYNVDKFIKDYCEGRTPRMAGVGTLPTSEYRSRLMSIVEQNKAK